MPFNLDESEPFERRMHLFFLTFEAHHNTAHYERWRMTALVYWRERHNDEEGTVEPLVLHQVGNECNGLDGFAKAHFISQDAI